MSPGFFTVTGSFDDNGEGLDKKFAIHYYSRFKFFTELAPLLLAAKEAEEEARVITVLGAGHGGELDRNDLGLFENYSVMKCGQQSLFHSVYEEVPGVTDCALARSDVQFLNCGGTSLHMFSIRPGCSLELLVSRLWPKSIRT
jgi:hypothetical protein